MIDFCVKSKFSTDHVKNVKSYKFFVQDSRIFSKISQIQGFFLPLLTNTRFKGKVATLLTLLKVFL